MTHLYVIRHAQPDGRKPEIIGLSPPNSGLSPVGVSQAERLRDRLATTNDLHVDVLVSSPMRRAKETAEILAPALGLPVLIDDGVQGLNLGACEGLTWDEIGERFGHPEMENEPFRRFAPDADSPASFALRTCEGFDRLTHHYEGKTIVIVCHSEVIEMTFRYFLGLPLLQYQLPTNLAPTLLPPSRIGGKDQSSGHSCNLMIICICVSRRQTRAVARSGTPHPASEGMALPRWMARAVASLSRVVRVSVCHGHYLYISWE